MVKKVRKFALIFLMILSSFFMTGCDAESIVQVINQVAQTIQEAVPAVQEVINSFSGIASQIETATSSASQPSQQQRTETTSSSAAGVAIPSTTAETIEPANTTRTTSGYRPPPSIPTNLPRDPELEAYIRGTQQNFPYSQVGAVNTSREAARIRSNFGVTLLDGQSWSSNSWDLTPGTWTSTQIRRLESILSDLPPNFRNCTNGFVIQGEIVSKNGSGEAGGLGFDPIAISANQTRNSSTFKHVVIHEMAHQFQARHPDLARLWARDFWPDGSRPTSPSVSNYGNVSATEDMAECITIYFTDPQRLRRHDPDRFRFIEEYVAR